MIGQKLKTSPPTGGHVFQRIGTTFKLNQDIIKTIILTKLHFLTRHNPVSNSAEISLGQKLLTKFHEDETRNQMLTDGRTDIRRTKTGHKGSPEQSVHNTDIIKPNFTTQDTNVLTKFHEDWATELNKTSKFVELISPATFALFENECKSDG
ncbi:hypothetical protein DPMN_117605 [Dreissena polymorpha]|uniref:Uncharacterized protein n=1 Tax=Dreissena polymorpha TaxID=45954 RepID=A0A9D4JQD3_DREPO|nr:hypothetical protein DPMN_117605 [Dreissena polymorpha]